MGRKPREINVGALSDEEWNYIYGLYLADGFSTVKKRKGKSWLSYETTFSLHEDQLAIVQKLMKMLRSIGLSPHMIASPHGKREIDVHVYSKALVLLLPNKKALMNKTELGEEFLKKRDLFTVQNGIPFVAGLIDGDGHCKVKDFRSNHMKGGLARWIWRFKQSTLVFLVDYIGRFVELLSLDGIRLTEEKRRGRRKCSVAIFHKSGIIALLEKGIAKYSWKVGRWQEDVARLESEVKAYYSLGEVASTLGVSLRVVQNLVKIGKLKYERRVLVDDEGGRKRRPWYFISGETVDQFLDETRIWRAEKQIILEALRQRLLLTTKQAAAELGVTKTSVIEWLRNGRIQFIPLLNLGGKNKKKYFIPVEEVKRLKSKLTRTSEKKDK
jgi:excisionase family DNA binding protein